jgi:hypothetical protein
MRISKFYERKTLVEEVQATLPLLVRDYSLRNYLISTVFALSQYVLHIDLVRIADFTLNLFGQGPEEEYSVQAPRYHPYDQPRV